MAKKKIMKALKNVAPLLAVAGLGKAFMNARNRKNQMKDFLATEGGDLSDMSNMIDEFGIAPKRGRGSILADPGINRITDYMPMKKGGRVKKTKFSTKKKKQANKMRKK